MLGNRLYLCNVWIWHHSWKRKLILLTFVTLWRANSNHRTLVYNLGSLDSLSKTFYNKRLYSLLQKFSPKCFTIVRRILYHLRILKMVKFNHFFIALPNFLRSYFLNRRLWTKASCSEIAFTNFLHWLL